MRGGPRRSCSIVAAALALAYGFAAVAGRAEDRPDPNAEASALGDDFRLGLSGEGRAFSGAEIEVLRFGSSRVLRSQVGRRVIEITCALCTPRELRTSARSLGAVLAAEAADRKPARLSVRGLPENGSAAVDGVPLEPPSSAHPVEPGDHVVALDQDGRSEETVVTVLPETAVALDAGELLLARKAQRRLKVLLGGLGVTAAAIGGVFLWLDGSCASAAVDAAGNCRAEHRLAPAGWTLVATGILAEVALLIWVFWPSGRGEGASGGAP